jgi:hypothetical protein
MYRSQMARVTAPWRLAGRFLAAATLTIGTLAASVATASAGSATGDAATYAFTSGSVNLKGGGHTWALGVSVTSGVKPRPWLVGIQITTPERGGQELHSWGTTMPAGDFSPKPTGAATINSGSSLRPIATLSLTYAPTSHKRAACSFGSEVVYSGTLSGSVKLTTALKGLKLSGKKLSFKRPNTLIVDDGCVPVHPPCDFSNWTGPESFNAGPVAAGITAGAPTRQESFSEVARTVALSAPTSKTTRIDLTTMKAKAPTFSKSAKTLSVTSSASGAVTGSATLSHARVAFSQTLMCSLPGQTYTEHETEYSAAFASPAGKHFESHTILTGTIKVAGSGAGAFTLVTLKKS